MKRAIVLVLDSFGIGAADDAEKFNDVGANTLGNIAKACFEGKANNGEFKRNGSLKLPTLASLGLLHAAQESCGTFPAGMTTDTDIKGAYGFACEISSGKDTLSGHWEIAGVPALFDFGYFSDRHNSFPSTLLNELIKKANLPGVLGNCHASGTTIISKLGEEHFQTGKPIVYTSSDSVFQIACHEESFGLDRLYELCTLTYDLLAPYNIARVIARPFIGKKASEFKRTGNRRDFSVPPPAPTVLDKLLESDGTVISIGKIADIFAHQGITEAIKATGIPALFDATVESLKNAKDRSLIFTNFVDFDSAYGHRRNVTGYAGALEYLDCRLSELLSVMKSDDILIITADHGCDPTWPGSDHTRENIPVLLYGQAINAKSLGRRDTFADIGQSIADYFELSPLDFGKSFLDSPASKKHTTTDR